MTCLELFESTEAAELKLKRNVAQNRKLMVELSDVSNVDSMEVEEVEFGSSGTDSDGRVDSKMGCVGNNGCKSELVGVARSKSSPVKAKSRASSSLVWLRFSVANKFESANLVSRFGVGIDFRAN